MQKWLTVFFAVTTVVFAGLYLSRGRGVKVEEKIVVLEKELETRTSELKQARAEGVSLKREKAGVVKQAEKRAAEIAVLQTRLQNLEGRMEEVDYSLAEEEAELAAPGKPELASPAAEAEEETGEAEKEEEGSEKEKSFGKMIAKMMKDPEMKKVMREQQKLQLDSMYGVLFDEMELSAEETETFKNLILDKQMSGMDLGMTVLEDGFDREKIAELGREVEQEKEIIENEIKEFLGEEQYAAYQKYEKSIVDRMTLNQFKQRLGSSGGLLEYHQEDQLLQAMREEREDTDFTHDFENSTPADFELFSEKNLEKYFQEEEELSQRVYERARNILTPDQLPVFKSFQEGQLSMKKMGMRMAAQMFGQLKKEKTGEDPEDK
jgi:hypothetical protein